MMTLKNAIEDSVCGMAYGVGRYLMEVEGVFVSPSGKSKHVNPEWYGSCIDFIALKKFLDSASDEDKKILCSDDVVESLKSENAIPYKLLGHYLSTLNIGQQNT